MSDVISFGTDGWRAIIAEDFTFANVEKVAYAVGKYMSVRLILAMAPVKYRY